MLIGFIGLPNSGKTTIASKVFGTLKENASNAELIVEQARFYIAKKRLDNKLSLKEPLALTDDDQLKIVKKQSNLENIMVQGTNINTYIISDSSVLNSMLYLSDEMFNNEDLKNEIVNVGNYDLLIYCHPFNTESFPDDPNRVHSKEQVEALEKRSKDLLSFIKKKGYNVKEILGTYPLDLRWKECLSTVTSEHLKFIQANLHKL